MDVPAKGRYISAKRSTSGAIEKKNTNVSFLLGLYDFLIAFLDVNYTKKCQLKLLKKPLTIRIY